METTPTKSGRLAQLFVLVLLFSTDSGIVNFSGLTGYYASMLLVMAIAGVGLLLFFRRERSRQPVSFIALLLALLFVCGTGYLLKSGIGPILKYACTLLAAYLIAQRWRFEDFTKTYTDVCFVVASAALLMYVVTTAVPASLNLLPRLSLTSGKVTASYYTIGLANMRFNRWEAMPRMYALFWEPGVCQAYFNLALLFAINNMKGRKQLIQIIVFVCCIVCTQSTTGFAACAFVLCYLIVSRNQSGRNVRTALRILLVVGVALLLINLQEFQNSMLFNSVFGKLDSSAGSTSVASRSNSIVGNLQIALRHPVYGVGLNNSDIALRQLFPGAEDLHQTNTVTNYLASFGLLVGLLPNICWVRFAARNGDSLPGKLLILGLLLSVLSGENFLLSLPFNVFMMYGYLYRPAGRRMAEPANGGVTT